MAIDLQELNSLLYTLSDNDIIDLPSGGQASVREMTGHEQRSFSNRAKLSNGTAIQDLLGACTVEFNGEALPADPQERTKFLLNALSADRRALMFGIRRHSLGNTFQFATMCPSCRAKGEWEVDLSVKENFPITLCPHGAAKEFTYESQVRKGLIIKVHMLDGNAEMALLRKRDNLHSLSDLEAREPKAAGLHDGKELWAPIQLQKLPDVLIAELRKQVKDNEGDIRTAVKVVCASCQSEVEFDLLQLQDFMIPSVTS